MKRPKFLSTFDLDGVSRATVNLPTILSALESAYLRADLSVNDIMVEMQGQITEGEWFAYQQIMQERTTIRDEYKAALQAAGYVFDNSTTPAS